MKNLLNAIDDVEMIFESEADWEFKYDAIFGIHSKVINPAINAAGLNFDWYDPDTTYEEDATAYVNALLELRTNIRKAFGLQ